VLDTNNTFTELKNAVANQNEFTQPKYTNVINQPDRLFYELDGKVYYIAQSDPNTLGLWVSDGTPAGTQLIRSSVSFSALSEFDNLFESGGMIYFAQELDLNNDGYADGSFLHQYNPQTGTTSRVTKDSLLIKITDDNRYTLMQYDSGFIPAGDYMFFLATLVPEDLNSGNTSDNLILGMNDTTGAIDYVLPQNAGYYETGIIDVMGNNLVFTGMDDQSYPERDFFTYDISGFNISDGGTGGGTGGSGDGGSGGSGGSSLPRKLFYAEDFYTASYDTTNIPTGWKITKNANPLYMQLRWQNQYDFGSNLPSRFLFEDSQFLTINPDAYNFFDNSDFNPNLDEELVSVPIPIEGKQGLSGSIEFSHIPAYMSKDQIVIAIDGRIDDGTWDTLVTLQGGSNTSAVLDTVALPVNDLGTGQTLQLRFRLTAQLQQDDGYSGLAFGFDHLRLFETSDRISDSSSVTETTVYEDDFAYNPDQVDSSRIWKVTRSSVDFVGGEDSQWHYNSYRTPDLAYNLTPGLSGNGMLYISPHTRENPYTMEPIHYDEIIASPMIALNGNDSLRISLNTAYPTLSVTHDIVEFNILGRPDTTSDWQVLCQIKPDPNQIGSMENVHLYPVDFNLSDVYSDDQIQVGLQLKINNYDTSWYAGEYYADSLRIYKRKTVNHTTAIEPVAKAKGFILHQNYPNPFNPTTTIAFDLPAAGKVSLRVYDILGRMVSELIKQRLNAGHHAIRFNASALASGMYFYRLTTQNFAETKRMLLIK